MIWAVRWLDGTDAKALVRHSLLQLLEEVLDRKCRVSELSPLAGFNPSLPAVPQLPVVEGTIEPERAVLAVPLTGVIGSAGKLAREAVQRVLGTKRHRPLVRKGPGQFEVKQSARRIPGRHIGIAGVGCQTLVVASPVTAPRHHAGPPRERVVHG